MIEKVEGKRVHCIGTTTEHDLHTGMHHVDFEDGEWDAFDDNKMGHHQMVKTTHRPHAPTQIKLTSRCSPHICQ